MPISKLNIKLPLVEEIKPSHSDFGGNRTILSFNASITKPTSVSGLRRALFSNGLP